MPVKSHPPCNTRLVLLHVLAATGTRWNAKDSPLAPTRWLSVSCEPSPKKPDAVVRFRLSPTSLHGNPAIEILAEAANRHASLIVLGATQRNVLQNLTRERTIYKVLAHARCPVLTLHEPKAEPEEVILARLAAHR